MVDPYHTSTVPYHAAASHYAAAGDEESAHLRQTPNHQFQDVIWAVAFYAHLIVVLCLILVGLQSSGGVSSGAYGGIIFTVSVTGVTALGLSLTALSFMMQNAESLVQTALFFSVASSLAVGIVGFIAGSMLMGILGIVSFAIGICYARAVWSRIPFAAVNLKTALTAVQQNLGLTGIALVLTGLAFVWTLLWFMGLGNYLQGNNLVVVFFLVRSPRGKCCKSSTCLRSPTNTCLYSSYRIIGSTKSCKTQCTLQRRALSPRGGLSQTRPAVGSVKRNGTVCIEQSPLRLGPFVSVASLLPLFRLCGHWNNTRAMNATTNFSHASFSAFWLASSPLSCT